MSAIRWAIATCLLGVGLWRLTDGVDEARLWWQNRLFDPSAADLYLTNAEVEVVGGLVAMGVGALLLWSGWTGNSHVGPSRTRRLVVTLGAAILLALVLRFGEQAWGRSRCEHAGGQWHPGLRVCVPVGRADGTRPTGGRVSASS